MTWYGNNLALIIDNDSARLCANDHPDCNHLAGRFQISRTVMVGRSKFGPVTC